MVERQEVTMLRYPNPEVPVTKVRRALAQPASDESIVVCPAGRVMARKSTWHLAMLEAKRLSRERGAPYFIESRGEVWQVGPAREETAQPAPAAEARRANPMSAASALEALPDVELGRAPNPASAAKPATHRHIWSCPHGPGYIVGWLRAVQTSGDPDEIMRAVGGWKVLSSAMLGGWNTKKELLADWNVSWNEIQTPKGVIYQVSSSGIENVFAPRGIDTDDLEKWAYAFEQDDERDSNPMSAASALEALPDVELGRAPNPASARLANIGGDDDDEAREDAEALGIGPDHVLMRMVGSRDPHMMHEALEAIEAMRPVVDRAKAHLLDHLAAYARARGGKLHGPSDRPPPMPRPNPASGDSRVLVDEALLSPAMNRRWRERSIPLFDAERRVLAEAIVPGETPDIARLRLAAEEGAVSLSQIDVALVELARLKKRYRPRTAPRRIVDALLIDLGHARTHYHERRITPPIGYDVRHHGVVNESEVAL